MAHENVLVRYTAQAIKTPNGFGPLMHRIWTVEAPHDGEAIALLYNWLVTTALHSAKEHFKSGHASTFELSDGAFHISASCNLLNNKNIHLSAWMSEPPPQTECEGHESLDGAHMGETVYCDGSPRKHLIKKTWRERFAAKHHAAKHAAGQWAITVDYFPDPGEKPGTNLNAFGLVGPHDATMTAEEIITHPDSKRFRMLDDDNEVWYVGHCYLPEGLDDSAFNPLDDFGEPNSGCTSIEYENNGAWEAL